VPRSARPIPSPGSPEHRTAPPPRAGAADPVPTKEVARLEAMRRLAMGAAHALNNAFTTLVGEASFVQEDRKADPVVA